MTPEQERQLNELIAWKEQKTRQQITYPLDIESIELLVDANFMRTERIVYFQDITSAVFSTVLFKNNLNLNQLNTGDVTDRLSQIFLNDPVRKFSADASNNTCTSQNHGFSNGNVVTLYSSQTDLDLPAPLLTGLSYYIISATTDTFKLSATFGGAEIDITDAGTGEHFITYYLQ